MFRSKKFFLMASPACTQVQLLPAVRQTRCIDISQNHFEGKPKAATNRPAQMSANNEQLKPSGAVSPDSFINDKDVKMPHLVIRTIDGDDERNAARHDRSQVNRGDETHVIPSTSSTSGVGTKRRTSSGRGHGNAASSSHHMRSPDNVLSSSIGKSEKPPASGRRNCKKKRSEMTTEELAEADRKRKRANVKSATESRQRRRALLDQLRQEACELQAANLALIRENQTFEYYIKHYNAMIEKVIQGATIVTDPSKINGGAGAGTPPTAFPVMNNDNNMTNNGSPTAMPQACVPSMQAPIQMQTQMPAQMQYQQEIYNSTQPSPWQNQQQQIQLQPQMQQQMPVGPSMMAPQCRGQEGLLWSQQEQQQHPQQVQSNPPDIYMQMAAILLNQAQQQQIQQRQIQQQQQHNQAVATAPTPSPWSQFPNGEAPVINPTNLAQIDASALISQIMNLGGSGGGWNNCQQMPPATTTMNQPQQPFFPLSNSQPKGYEQPSATNNPSMCGVSGYQQPNGEALQSANAQNEAQSMPAFFSTRGIPQNNNDTSTAQQQQQDDPSFWLAQLQSLGLPDEIRINLQDSTHDEVLDDDLFDKLDGGNLGYTSKEE